MDLPLFTSIMMLTHGLETLDMSMSPVLHLWHQLSFCVCFSCGDALVWLVTQLIQKALQAVAGGQKPLPSLTSAQHPHVTLLRALPQRSQQLGAEVERLLLADVSAQ